MHCLGSWKIQDLNEPKLRWHLNFRRCFHNPNFKLIVLPEQWEAIFSYLFRRARYFSPLPAGRKYLALSLTPSNKLISEAHFNGSNAKPDLHAPGVIPEPTCWDQPEARSPASSLLPVPSWWIQLAFDCGGSIGQGKAKWGKKNFPPNWLPAAHNMWHLIQPQRCAACDAAWAQGLDSAAGPPVKHIPKQMGCKKEKPPPNLRVSVPSGVSVRAENPPPDLQHEENAVLSLSKCVCGSISTFYVQPTIQEGFRDPALEATPFSWQASYVLAIPRRFPVKGPLLN